MKITSDLFKNKDPSFNSIETIIRAMQKQEGPKVIIWIQFTKSWSLHEHEDKSNDSKHHVENNRWTSSWTSRYNSRSFSSNGAWVKSNSKFSSMSTFTYEISRFFRFQSTSISFPDKISGIPIFTDIFRRGSGSVICVKSTSVYSLWNVNSQSRSIPSIKYNRCTSGVFTVNLKINNVSNEVISSFLW